MDTPKKPVLKLALAVLISMALAMGAIWISFSTFSDSAPPTTSLPDRIKLLPETTKVFSEREVLRSDGTVKEVHVQYRTGETGVRYVRQDGTLSEVVVRFADGVERVRATFDFDGETITAGFQLRQDRSKMWETETLPDGTIKTITYWFGGKTIFSTEFVDLKAKTAQTTYYRENGQLWAKQVQDLASKTVVEEELWSAQGTPERAMAIRGNTTTVTYYRADGSKHFTQTWYKQPSSGYYYWYASTNLTKIEEFGPDGKATRTFILSDYGYNIRQVIEHKPDGTTKTTDYTGWNSVRDSLPEEFFRSIPLTEKPDDQWKRLEQENAPVPTPASQP